MKLPQTLRRGPGGATAARFDMHEPIALIETDVPTAARDARRRVAPPFGPPQPWVRGT